MRTAITRRAPLARALGMAVLMLGVAVPAGAQRAGQASRAPAAGPAEGEEDRYFARANALRDRILAQTAWESFGSGECRAGALRVFSTDSASAERSTARDLIAELERIIIVRGVGTPLDTAPVRDLLHAVAGWEAGLTRPKWDVAGKEKPREAIAAGLTGEALNPITGKCETLVPFDTVNVVLPEGLTIAPMMKSDVQVRVENGAAGINRLRDDFFTATRNLSVEATLTYTHVISVVYWRDYAVVAVNRPAELRGAVLSKKSAGGAAYLFRRVKGGEWRLLTITRTW